MPRKPSFPKYSVRKDGIAYITLAGRKHQLGKDGEKAQRRYSAICGRIAAGIEPRLAVQVEDDGTVTELVAAYMREAEAYYCGSSEYTCMLHALEPLVRLFGDLAPNEFGPRDLVAIRCELATSDRVRGSANHQLSRIKKFWRWCCEHEHCDPLLYHKLTSVRGIRKGEGTVVESHAVRPVRYSEILLVLPYVSPTVGAMLQVQYLCGMRPQDVCGLRAEDIDQSDAIWIYQPGQHKNDWRGQGLVKAIPPRAQAVLSPLMHRDGYLFSPRDAYLWWHRNRTDKPATIRRKIADRYTAGSYRKALAHGFAKAAKAGVYLDRWTPNQLRHGILSEVSYTLGAKAAQEWAGHKREATTAIYTSADHQRRVAHLRSIANQLEANWGSA